MLSRRLKDVEPSIGKYIDVALEGARRATQLTQRLLAFSRRQALSPKAMDPNRLVFGMSELLRGTLGRDIMLEAVTGGSVWQIFVDPGQLENAILNVALNARDAMPTGGRLTIETQNAYLDDRYAAAHLGTLAGQYVLISITDTGSGIPQDIINKVYDPFFTTKVVGKGTGLGLSQVYGFVKQSGGHIKIYSEPSKGTSVKIYLPRHTQAEAADETDTTPNGPPCEGQQELVLVVDDEPAVRELAVDALKELGYRTMEAMDGIAALKLLEQDFEIDLLLTDIVMPELNGRMLVDQARQKRPDLKVLYMTGFTRNAVVHNGVLDAGVHLIGKPFTIEELADKVRLVLDS
jgi:CheY-like chemotaxis protein